MCAATLGIGAAMLSTDAPPREHTGRRRPRTCSRCGHPQRLHRQEADGHEPVVRAPLPLDLPDPIPSGPVDPSDRAESFPTEPAPSEPQPVPEVPLATEAPDEGAFVQQIRELAELYRTGMLDAEEFAAAKALVLRHHQG